jgi:hypothetical protein
MRPQPPDSGRHAYAARLRETTRKNTRLRGLRHVVFIQPTEETPEMSNTASRIKTHLGEHKGVYITAAVATGVGVAVGLGLANKDAIRILVIGNNNTVVAVLERRGHPGYLVRCLETGEVYSSINRAAKACSVNAGNLCRHLNGHLDHVKGLHFEKLGEAS